MIGLPHDVDLPKRIASSESEPRHHRAVVGEQIIARFVPLIGRIRRLNSILQGRPHHTESLLFGGLPASSQDGCFDVGNRMSPIPWVGPSNPTWKFNYLLTSSIDRCVGWLDPCWRVCTVYRRSSCVVLHPRVRSKPGQNYEGLHPTKIYRHYHTGSVGSPDFVSQISHR